MLKDLTQLHDARLIGIEYLGNDIRLTTKRTDDVEVRLLLVDVAYFVANNLLTGNIINSVNTTVEKGITVEKALSTARKHISYAFSSEDPTSLPPHPAWKQLINGEMHLVHIDSSYGAEICAVIKSMRIEVR
jgi:hypothetical protein